MSQIDTAKLTLRLIVKQCERLHNEAKHASRDHATRRNNDDRRLAGRSQSKVTKNCVSLRASPPSLRPPDL
jgi:hypothetical protein